MSLVTCADCQALDTADPLRHARGRFVLPEGRVYLDGNSLGALPKAAPELLQRLLQVEWGTDLITSWNKHGWIDMPAKLGAKIARLIGAKAEEVLVCDSTSINIFKLLAVALALNPKRRVILSDRNNFPTDLYMAQGLATLNGGRSELKLVERGDIAGALTEDVAVLMLTEVDYRSGDLYDMRELTAKAQAAGVLAIWDLAHSAGALPVDLNGAGADFAVGCGYKYLNGGPGAPAYLFVAERWHDKAHQPLYGWMGHAAPFELSTDYRPRAGIRGFAVGTPPMLSLAGLEAGLDTFDGIDMNEVRKKSLALGDLMIRLVEQECAGFGLKNAAPIGGQRGSQVSFRHPESYAAMQALIARGVIGDFRAPDLMRFGLTPLYTGYADIWDAVAAIKAVMEAEEWRKPAFRQRAAVT